MKQVIKKVISRLLWEGVERKVRKEDPYVIAVTGSVGKTSAKEAIAGVVAKSGRPVTKTLGNMGTDFGVPLSLLGFEENPQGFFGWLSAVLVALIPPITKSKERPIYVLEYSADKPGDIGFLVQKLPIDVAVITRISPVHMQAYANFADLVKEKTSLLTGLKPGGYAVLNADDPAQVECGGSLSNVVWYGVGKKAAGGVAAEKIELTAKGLHCSLSYGAARKMDTIGKQQPHTMELQTQVIGEHQLYPLLAAAAVGFAESLSVGYIKKALEAYHLPNGRGRLIEGVKDITIIDDTYNASPEAVKAGLKMLRPFAKDRRVVAILGSMNELGAMAEDAHAEVGKEAGTRVDFLVAVGQYGQRMLQAAKKAGLPESQMISFDKPEQLLDKMEQVVQRRDVVYVKASQNGMKLERVVKKIMAHPKEANTLLVRQSAMWQ